jgi:hypothetical protein
MGALDELDMRFSLAEVENPEGTDVDPITKEFDWSDEQITAHYSSLQLHRKCPE